jgi:osmoprotectant transport system permease protein
MLTDLWNYLSTSTNWSGRTGLANNITQHLIFTGIAIGAGILIAVPLGMVIGHTGKGSVIVVGSLNASRALPTFGLMVFLYVLISPLFTGRTQLPQIIPVEIVLLLLAIPPILSNTYAGFQSVDPAARDAARGMGMTGWQIVTRVELPNAFPLMMSGLRSATLQVVSTATVGAYIGLGGLGLPILNAIRQGPFMDTPIGHVITGRLLAGAVLVAALALALDLILATIQRLSTSRGITRRYRRSQRPVPAEVSLASPS